jgi:hypothetical protein
MGNISFGVYKKMGGESVEWGVKNNVIESTCGKWTAGWIPSATPIQSRMWVAVFTNAV